MVSFSGTLVLEPGVLAERGPWAAFGTVWFSSSSDLNETPLRLIKDPFSFEPLVFRFEKTNVYTSVDPSGP